MARLRGRRVRHRRSAGRQPRRHDRHLGPEPDADGYTVSIDGAAAEPIAVNATRHSDGLAAGQHAVELAGLAGNCAVAAGASVTVAVDAGAAAAVRFEVACAATTGTVEVATTSAGSPPDADGYQIQLDGAASQPIGTSATVSIPGVTPGSHTVGLGGLAANCAVDGDNPRAAAVVAGATVRVAISVTCSPLPPSTGTIEISTATTGPSQDPDGYSFTIDAGNAQPIGVNGTASVAGFAAGSHSVRLREASANCTIADNPRTVTVAAGETTATAFAITCTATTGALAVTITGLPAGTNAAVTVTGPSGFNRPVTATATLADLAPGSYTVAAANVSSGGTQYTPSPPSRGVDVAAGATASATVTYGPAAGPSLNLRIDGWFLTQSVQSAAGDVPLVQGRDGFIRVFVVADQPNTARPSVRLRLYRNGALARTFDIPAPGPSTPLSRDEATLASSWNVKIPRDLFEPGMAVLAEVDPANAIAEKNEADNSFPVSGASQPETLHSVPPLGVRFVPVRQQTSGLTGDVSATNRGSVPRPSPGGCTPSRPWKAICTRSTRPPLPIRWSGTTPTPPG